MRLEFTKYGKQTSDMHWLTSVKGSNDDRRQHHQTVLIKDDFAYKTDGSRLFRVHNNSDETWTDGVYDVLKRIKSNVILVKRDDDPTWPDCEELFVDTSESKQDFAFNESTIDRDIKELFKLTSETESTFHIKWLLALVSGDNDFIGHIMDDDGIKPLIFDNGSKAALVMPKRC